MTETYDTLMAKVKIIAAQLKFLDEEIEQLEKQGKGATESSAEADELASFMSGIQSSLSVCLKLL